MGKVWGKANTNAGLSRKELQNTEIYSRNHHYRSNHRDEQKDIFKELKNFYEDLYKETPLGNNNPIEDFFPENYVRKVIKQDTSQKCEQKVTEQELYDALHSKESSSAPGDDGISYSFYKTFYGDLKHVLLDCRTSV